MQMLTFLTVLNFCNTFAYKVRRFRYSIVPDFSKRSIHIQAKYILLKIRDADIKMYAQRFSFLLFFFLHFNNVIRSTSTINLNARFARELKVVMNTSLE